MTDDLRTIEGAMCALAKADPTALVYIDNRHPTALSSYRGDYSDLAIERNWRSRNERTELYGCGESFELNMAGYGTYTPGHIEVSIKADPTVADLILALSLAVGEEFEGYKGGRFAMYPGTRLWVSEYGDCDHLVIDRAEELPGRFDLFTREMEW